MARLDAAGAGAFAACPSTPTGIDHTIAAAPITTNGRTLVF
jgi:hypothetical protein